MPDTARDIETLDRELQNLESGLASTTRMSASFTAELATMQTGLNRTQRESTTFSRALSRNLSSSFGDLLVEGEKLSVVFRDLGRSLVETTLQSSLNPITNRLGELATSGLTGLFSNLLPFEKGGAFSSGRVIPFAKGGVVSSPQTFPMRGGTGLMGEAGAEAILPLSRGADGRLGVKTAGGGGAITINMNISTPDATSFRRSQGQIAAGLRRAVLLGQRNS